MAAETQGFIGNQFNPFASQLSGAVNASYGGSKDDWYHNRKANIKDDTKLLIMKYRRTSPFWHVLLEQFPKLQAPDMFFHWDEQEYVPTSWTPTAGATYTVTVSTDAAKMIKENDLLSVDGIYVVIAADGLAIFSTAVMDGLTYSGVAYKATIPETVEVISRDLSTGVLTVRRASGATINTSASVSAAVGTGTVTPPVFTTSMKLFAAGSVKPEIINVSGGFRRNAHKVYGCLKVETSDTWYTTKIEDNIKYTMSKPVVRMMIDARRKFLKGIDRGFLHAWRQGGTTRLGSSNMANPVYSSTSLLEQIPSSNYLNYNDVLSPRKLNKFLHQVFDVGSEVKYGFTTRDIMDELAFMNEQRFTYNVEASRQLGHVVGELRTADGKTLRLIEDREMEEFGAYTNSIMIVDFGDSVGPDSTNTDPYLQYVYLRNCDVQIMKVPEGKRSGITITDEEFYWGVFGLRVAFSESHFMMYNIKLRS